MLPAREYSDQRGARAQLLCTRCVLPQSFPGIRFDANGVCNLCAESAQLEPIESRRRRLTAEIDRVVEESRGSAEYDCVVAFSGGKDSSFTLKYLVEHYALKCLAVTVDNGFIAPQAVENCKTVTAALAVDFLIYTPSPAFMQRMYVASVTRPIHAPAAIRRASSMCNSCISLINNYMLRTAVRQRIPIVAGGYVGGQVPTDAAVIRIRPRAQAKARETSVRKYVEALGDEARGYFDLPANDGGDGDCEVFVINPMLGVGKSEAAIVEEVRAIGWRPVPNVGRNSTNCMLNDLGIAVHHRQHGFHPYVLEVSEQVRAGLMTRDEALEKVGRIPEFSSLATQIRTLGLRLV
jgi:tRNA(Ile)-lysidine synthase TilS/MesJ